jgi:hypothetical protein
MNRTATIILLGTMLTACGDEAGSGTLRLTTYGEDFIEQEIPSGQGGGEGFTDGYTVKFSNFLVVFSALKVAHNDGTVAGEVSGPLVFDMHPKGPHLIKQLDSVPSMRWDRVGVSIKPGPGATAGNAVSAADVKLLNDKGYSSYMEGTASKGAASYTFRWGFSTTTSYSQCHEKTHGQGIVVPSGGSATAEFTVHGDHLFYDDLQSSDPSLRFEAMAAADADKDGEVTLAELAKVDLTTLPAGQYGTGGSGTVKNLRQFVEALSRTLIHYQGEGHCHSGS